VFRLRPDWRHDNTVAREADDIAPETLRLLVARHIGPATLRRLRARFATDERICCATASALQHQGGINGSAAHAIRRAIDRADPEAERESMRAAGVRLLERADPDYPESLASIPRPPEALWVRGVLPVGGVAVAIVGARRCSSYGRRQAARFASRLAAAGLDIVSGGARGIDAEAHRATMRAGGRTIAVLGAGLAQDYPRGHAPMFRSIVESGGTVISEHPMAMPPRAANFPRRNRIISGLSAGVIVVEAAARSGALITARLAVEEHGRDAWAVPGPVDAASSRGCLELLRDGGAGLAITPDDVLATVAPRRSSGHAALPPSADLEPVACAVLELLRTSGKVAAVDEIIARGAAAPAVVQSALTILQLRGLVVRDGAGVRAVTA